MKNKRRTRQPAWGEADSTTSKDWGHGPVAGKGGKTTNADIPVGNYYKAIKGKN